MTFAGENFGITCGLYGFTHARYSLRRTRATTSMVIKHNYPAEYMQHFDEATFLDDDASAMHLVAGVEACLWTESTEWEGLTDAQRIRDALDDERGMTTGVSMGLIFANGKGLAGVGLAAQNTSPKDFDKMFRAKSAEMRAMVTTFDSFMRPCMVKNRFKLTPREKDVLAFSACGMGAKAIAAHLGIKPKSVFNILERAKKSLSAENSMEAIAKAYTYDLL